VVGAVKSLTQADIHLNTNLSLTETKMKFQHKLLVIPDIHTHYEKAERIIQKFNKTHKFIFLGDYFDQFGDTPEINSDTAHWLKVTMNSYPDWVYILGNHDLSYMPQFSLMCSGFSTQKKTAINEVLLIEDWNKLKYFHFENDHWFSHAGITKHWFQHPMREKISVDNVQRIIDDAVIKLKTGDDDNAIWAASSRRGGSSPVGSIVWHDWSELELIPEMSQVVGHSPVSRIITISDDNTKSSITNVDTSASRVYMTELLEIDENGKRKKIDTSFI
jgi:hypothetical protein